MSAPDDLSSLSPVTLSPSLSLPRTPPLLAPAPPLLCPLPSSLHRRAPAPPPGVRRRARAGDGGAGPRGGLPPAAERRAEELLPARRRISAAELRARARQQERRPRAARSSEQGRSFIFFVCQKCFGTGWSFQPVPMDTEANGLGLGVPVVKPVPKHLFNRCLRRRF